ncbi:MAG: endonuclease/exonuclease/phosphatase family protein [Candidatus Daviesbacteria bacterium]|nr:endonuclease/exonuclease/phosphatase family protein [Candidatus Daviesbacteria bacterium]
MRLISLNTWGGKVFEPLMQFIQDNSVSSDIFCFQEIFSTTSNFKQFPEYRANLLEEISKILPDFNYFFDSVMEGLDIEANPVEFNLKHGLATFVRKDFSLKDYRNFFLYKNKTSKLIKKKFSDIPVNIQLLNFTKDSKEFIVCNFHGASFPGSKKDTPQRIEQSQKIRNLLKEKDCAKIIVGDFNLLPNTKSISILEEDLRNLIKEYNIQKTRSRIDLFYGKDNFQKFADYTFVSRDINIIDFQVPYVEVSDHLPMILEFS